MNETKRQPTPHIVVKRPRCVACNAVLPKPYKRVRHEWGEVHYVKCRCGQNNNLDIL